MESTNPLLLKECNETFVKTLEALADVSPLGAEQQFDGVTIVKTGIPSDGFNTVFGLDRPRSLSNIYEIVNRLFIDTKTPWELVTTSEISNSFIPMIERYNLRRAAVEPGMHLQPLPETVAQLPKGLEIKRVTGREEMTTFLKVGNKGFGSSSEIIPDFLVDALSNQASGPPHACYLGYSEGLPVATSLRGSYGKSAGIFFVATLPEYRRRGFGEALTLRAAVDAKEDGCVQCFLQSSEMGYRIYEKIGFRKIVEYEMWRPAGQSQNLM